MSHVDDSTLSAYLDADGSLSDADIITIENHLAKCPACQQNFEETRRTKERAASILELSGPSHIAKPPFAEISARAPERGEHARRTQLFRLRRLAAAATVVLAVSVGVYAGPRLATRARPPTPPEPAAVEITEQPTGDEVIPAEAQSEIRADAPARQSRDRTLAVIAADSVAPSPPAGRARGEVERIGLQDAAGAPERVELRESAPALARAPAAVQMEQAPVESLADNRERVRLIDCSEEEGFLGALAGRPDMDAQQPPVMIPCLPIVSVTSEESAGKQVTVVTQQVGVGEFVTLRVLEGDEVAELDDLSFESDSLNTIVARVGELTVQATGRIAVDSLRVLLKRAR